MTRLRPGICICTLAMLVTCCSGNGNSKQPTGKTPPSDGFADKPSTSKLQSAANRAVQQALAAHYKVPATRIRISALSPNPPANLPRGMSAPWQPVLAQRRGMPQQRAFATPGGDVFMRLTHPAGLQSFVRAHVVDGSAKANPTRLAKHIMWVYERAGRGVMYPAHADNARVSDAPARLESEADGSTTLSFRVTWFGKTGSTGEHNVDVHIPVATPTSKSTTPN